MKRFSTIFWAYINGNIHIFKICKFRLIRLRETGLMDHWMSSYLSNIDKCLIKEKHSVRDEIHHFTALNISHQVGAFLLLAIGISSSLLSYLCELILFKIMIKKQTVKERLLVDSLLSSFKLAAQIVLE